MRHNKDSDAERCPSGRRSTPGKCVYGNVSRVRIPLALPDFFLKSVPLPIIHRSQIVLTDRSVAHHSDGWNSALPVSAFEPFLDQL